MNGSEREEILVSRVAGGQSSPADWAELATLGQRDPGLWERLNLILRHDAALSEALNRALACAERVELAAAPRPAALARRVPWWSWSGWAAAVALLLWVQVQLARRPAPPAPPAAPAQLTTDQALQEFRRLGRAEGRFLGELPALIMAPRWNPESMRLEVLFVRPLVERAEIQELYRLHLDEAGVAQPRPVSSDELLAGPRVSM